ncbi:MAG TPA: glycine/sarcosine/betaine reductase complex component C subunit beta [Candidatus Binatia bacterium]
MEKNQRPNVTRVGIGGVFYSLAHVPGLVRYGSKPSRVIRSQPSFGEDLNRQSRSFSAAVAYAPHQVYIGNVAPEQLKHLEKPWSQRLIEGARARGSFGDIVDQESLYCALAQADQFDLVTLDEKWAEGRNAKQSNGRTVRLRSAAEIASLCGKGALPLESNGELIGAFDAGHPEDPNLTADVLLENLAAKVTAAHSLRSLLASLEMRPEEIDFVISCSEEAIGDRYNRGGGNLAKAIAEEAGCSNASGSDVKAFCAGPLYAMIHGASLIHSGVCRNVVVVAGGSLAKLGMKSESHIAKNMPVLEDVLGSFAVLLRSPAPGEACLRLDSAAFHPVGAGASPQAMAEYLAEKPLAKLGMRLTDVDRYAVELHNPEITVPSGSGDVPRTNYLTLAALAVMRREIARNQMEDFVATRGMVGYAPTQGHIPSAIAYLGHAIRALRERAIRNALFISKGSLFLGRMTQLSDGCSFLIDGNENDGG